jgi:long-subunit acyl-CoA synthetase (AMP-forming)
VECSQLIQHLAGIDNRHIHYFDEAGQPRQRSFQALADQAAALASRLAAAGLTAGDRVGIHADNSVEWLLWDIAVMSLGGIVVALPDDIVRQHDTDVFQLYMLRLAAVGKTAQSHRLTGCTGAVPIAAWQNGTFRPYRFEHGATAPDRDLGNDACALAFSSGTAGVPKCIVVNRRGIEWDAAHYFPQFSPTADDRILLFLPLTHQQQRLLAYAAYWLGTSIVLTRPESLFDAFTQLQPSLCLAPPLFYEGVHDRFVNKIDALSPWQRTGLNWVRRGLRALPSPYANPLKRLLFRPVHRALGLRMRIAVTGMAPIRHTTLAFFEEIGLPLYEAYGLTETGVIASNIPGANRMGSVGRLVPGCRVQIAPDGEILVAREAFACVGYFSPTDAFIPFARDAFLPTGDIGEIDADGFLYLRGRKKEIIITAQGHKIHPELVESRLNASPRVTRSVVFGDARKHLSALIVVRHAPDEAARADIDALVEQVNGTLGDTAMIGEVVVTHEAFSLQNGLLNGSLKVNRRAVAERFFPDWFAVPAPISKNAAGDDAADPVSETVRDVDPALLKLVKDAWESVMDIGGIDIHANFFEIGGDSLCAMRIIGRLQGKVETALAPSALFLDPSIYAIAAKLTEERQQLAQTPITDHTIYEEGSL